MSTPKIVALCIVGTIIMLVTTVGLFGLSARWGFSTAFVDECSKQASKATCQCAADKITGDLSILDGVSLMFPTSRVKNRAAEAFRECLDAGPKDR